MRLLLATTGFFFFLNTCLGQTRFQKDFAYYWQTIKENFAYADRQLTDWEKVRSIYQPRLDTIRNQEDFIHFLEKVNDELYNGHVFLNTNTPSSNRTIPTGADIKVSWINKKFVITEVRQGFNADICGLKTGMEIVKFNTNPIDEAVKKFLPQSISKWNREIYEYAANMLLAGTHDIKREITVRFQGQEKIFHPDLKPNKTEENPATLLEAKVLPGNTGYIILHNSLGNQDLIRSFDRALDSLRNTTGLILDLRETPSGGNTTVARAIMGRFIDKELPYQKHIYAMEEKETGIKRSTLELVSPRGWIYKKPLIILVGYWTGSMGEGMAIGFDGMKRAAIVGTKMAGLLGEIYSFEMPETKIPFSFPCVQLQHINGQPREEFMPKVIVADQNKIIETSRALLKKMNKNQR